MFQGQTLQPGTLTEDQMRFAGVARSQPAFMLGQESPQEMFRDRLTGELVTKEQVDSLGGMQTLLSPRQKTRVLENNRANLLNMQAAQERAAIQPIRDRRARMDIAPPTRPGGIENLSGSLGGQIRPSPYSAPQMPQMGGGFGGGQGMQQFMQFMQTMMQMFQQLQGGGGRGMGGGFQGQMRPRPQTYGRSPYGGY